MLQGKVFQNRMIDLGITNNKLYHRACGIISKFAQVDLSTATCNLLRAIYGVDATVEVPSSILNAPISDHVNKASRGTFKNKGGKEGKGREKKNAHIMLRCFESSSNSVTPMQLFYHS